MEDKSKNTKERRGIAAATALCFFIEAGRGMDTSIYNTLQPYIMEYFGTSLTVTSLFSTAEGIGHMLINVIIVWLADRFNKANVLTLLVLSLAGIMLGIGSAPTIVVYMTLKFMQGMISPFMDNVNTGYTSDLHPEDRRAAVGAIFMMFSLASAVMPTYNAIVVEMLGLPWYRSYTGVGIYLGIVGVALFICNRIYFKDGSASEFPKEQQPISEPKKKLSVISMLKNRNMAALFVSNVTMSFYNYFSATLPTYLYFLNADIYTMTVRTAIVTCSSIGRLVSRVLYVPMSKHVDTIWYMRFQAILGTVINLACFIINKPIVWMIGMAASGLLCGSAFTARTVLTCDEYPEYSSAACAATAIAQSVAALFATPLISLVADNVDFTVAMMIPIAFGFATYFVYKFMYKKRETI